MLLCRTNASSFVIETAILPSTASSQRGNRDRASLTPSAYGCTVQTGSTFLNNCLTLARKHLFQRFADGFVWLGGQLCLKTANIACKTQSACSCAIVFCMMTFPDVTSKKGEFGINFCTFAAGSRSRFGLPLPLQSPEFPDSPRKDGSWSQCIDRPSEL
jgi:hypothetical protein